MPDTINQTLETGTYEIIQGRLQEQMQQLVNKIQELNAARKNIFGAIETKLITNARIQTENNCISRDMVTVGEYLVFGYNVHFGLRTEIKLEDVFAIFKYENSEFVKQSYELIEDAVFIDDFVNLYKYYRQTRFYKFFQAGNYVYMIFQLSDSVTDIKAFKWLIKDGTLVYVDNRSEYEYKFPPQHEFEWQSVPRENHRYGKHPHVSILDKVFVETINGDLTIKVEDNTESGQGIYSESVEHKDQTLDDGGFRYADLGNLIALEIKPFQETARYFIYNHKIKAVHKIDSIKDAAILLPDNHGVIFSNGYYLQSGEYKIIENRIEAAKFQQKIASPNGEDFLYVFFEPEDGRYILLQYNSINQTIQTPIICNGFTLLANGELCYFITEAEQTRNHTIQVWQTPFAAQLSVPETQSDSLLYKIGNKDVVRAISEIQALVVLLNKEDNYSGLYNDLLRYSKNILDSYYWLNYKEAYLLDEPLKQIYTTASLAIDEFEKVVQLRKQAKEATDTFNLKLSTVLGKVKGAHFQLIDDFVMHLSSLRMLKGEVMVLKEMRYINLDELAVFEKEIDTQTEHLSRRCIEFLLQDEALKPYQVRVEEKQKQIESITKVVDGRALQAEMDQIGTDMEMLIEIVNNLQIEDATQSTKIIDNIALIFSTLNQAKAGIKNKIDSLGINEATADFAAQLKLVDQSIINYLDLANTVDKIDDYLNKVTIQIEELENRFSGFETFSTAILEKREEVQLAFDNRRSQLMEQQSKQATQLEQTAIRILNGVVKKSQTQKSVEAINAYFAGDIMVSKYRQIIEQLKAMDEASKVETLETRLKAAIEDSKRQLKDKLDLFEDGENVIRFGEHKFAVNRQPLELTIINKNNQLNYHLTSTDFYKKVSDTRLLTLEKYGMQEYVSENDLVYRSEYLAYKIFQSNEALESLSEDALLQLVREEASKNYTEGYIKGVHDADAFLILKALIQKHHHLGILRYNSDVRAYAQFFVHSLDKKEIERIGNAIKSAGEINQFFGNGTKAPYIITALLDKLNVFAVDAAFLPKIEAHKTAIAHYLLEEWQIATSFTFSQKAIQLNEKFHEALAFREADHVFKASVKNADNLVQKLQLCYQWVMAFLNDKNNPENFSFAYEIVALELFRDYSNDIVIAEYPVVVLEGFYGSHTLINDGKYTFNYHAFMDKLNDFATTDIPMYNEYRRLRSQLIADERQVLRLHEFEPKVLTSFVRNKLIDQVYLSLIGNNLSRQLGASGNNRRTDRSGMLLLVSPPGYGKTTLMEYVASHLGLVFMKINGPALGHDITSVDPMSATNSAAREELKKLNLGLEMGNNVMLYIDDIQHCSPEFLQKFISLADGTRRIEGVFEGQAKTYDMRSKRFCIVMAGNPYTESGEKFKIPDMLANRSDIYNLGDIIGSNDHLFKLSLIENAVTSNPVLNELSSKSSEDLYTIIAGVENGFVDESAIKTNVSRQELDTYTSVVKKVVAIRDVVMKVNSRYIESAAMDDAYRVEPAFKLQGSYRDMNKLVSKVVPIMNDTELDVLLLSHYENESQTLTSAAEANMLKYKEMTGIITPGEAKRWEDIKAVFVKNNAVKYMGGQQGLLQIAEQFAAFNKSVELIKQSLDKK
ncbi:DNA repair ATPase [Polluticaenibacter yanchengensis]|uniref:DNA repair ATPase n=1 Tax=Polluticaenibacter yanchengensis TaxID=3014562 RepID=A0ABT4UN09_9BACT|nr:DNA repair ATPase [Chitinophagaceae bacterium LY-5]